MQLKQSDRNEQKKQDLRPTRLTTFKYLHSRAEAAYESPVAIAILFKSPLSKREKAFKQCSSWVATEL
jgi:hypothetical protein